MLLLSVLCCVLCVGVWGYDPCANNYPDPDFLYGTFPPGFMWSSATAAYQVEGAWNVSGKGPSIWDHFCHRNPSPIAFGQSGDVACDSYHKYPIDIQLMKAIGLKYYRMSISWPRLIPTGIVAQGVNMDGYRYYRTLLQELVNNGIQPMVTLYHWDLPQGLQERGGWTNSDSVQWFTDYADLSYTLFGDLVKIWITFNEPWVVTVLGYAYGAFAPGLSSCPGTCPYWATHNIIKSHAHAYRLYDRNFRISQHGMVGMTMNCDYKIPNSMDAATVAATYRAMQFQLGWFAHPIYKNGDYPQEMKDTMMNRSMAEGRVTSRLPTFTPQEKAFINGSFDFFGINMYTSYLVKNAPNNPLDHNNPPSYYWDSETTQDNGHCGWTNSASDWLKKVPWGARGLLNWIKTEYGNPYTIITENGWSDDGRIADLGRIDYYRSYLNEVLKAIKIDGCNVHGYTAWSLMDNFEWTSGYTQKFGIHQVNFTDPNRARTAKDSARYLTQLVANNGFPNTGSSTPQPNTTPAPPISTAPTTKPPTTAHVRNCSCGSASRIITQQGGSQILDSPNYPAAYCSNLNCEWKLVVGSSQRIQLAFTKFDTESGYDILTVSNTDSSTLEVCSGSTMCGTVQSTGSRMTVTFTSDEGVEGAGFNAIFTAV